MSSGRREPNIEAIWNAQDAQPLVMSFAVLLIFCGLPASIGYAYFTGTDFRNFFGLFMAVLGGLGLFYVRRHQVRWAISLLLWGFWGLLSLWGFLVLGIRTPVLAALPALILLSGWLLGKRSATLMALFSVLVLSLLYYLDVSGQLPMRPRQAGDYYVAYMLMFLMAGHLAGYFSKSFRKQFLRLQETRQSLEIQLEALRHSEERFALLFRTNPLPSMMSRTSDGAIYEVNAAWEEEFGWNAEEVRGKRMIDIGFCTSEEECRKVSASTGPEGGAAQVFQLARREGQLRSYLVSMTVTEIEGEKRTIAAMLDQTERLEMEEAVRKLNASLEAQVSLRTVALSQALETLKNAQAELLESEKLASLGALVAGISHELNTPIGNALTVASTLQERAHRFNQVVEEGAIRKSELLDFLKMAEEMSDLLYRSCRRSSDLIHSFKQIAVDQTTERRREFDLRVLVEDVLATLRPSFKKYPWTVALEVPAGILCDSYPGPLVQVLTNLIQNALIHAFDGLETGELVIDAHLTTKGMVKLNVQDNGRGMDAATRKRIFDPFFTTRMGRGGTGLGLSISHQITTAVLGGTLKVSSRLGHGSTFTLSFPQRAAGTPERPLQ